MLDPETLHELFEKHNGEYLKKERIESVRRKHARPDLNAFLLLDSLVPGTRDMVSDAEHDEIYLDAKLGDFCKVATEADVIDLIRCGVLHDREFDCFCMFV